LNARASEGGGELHSNESGLAHTNGYDAPTGHNGLDDGIDGFYETFIESLRHGLKCGSLIAEYALPYR
jgi:hypothetical protein